MDETLQAISPPPVQQGDWIEMKVALPQWPWAIVRNVYAPGWIEVSYCSSDGVDKNDWKWMGRSWGIFADYGMALSDRHGLHRQRLLDGPPDDLPAIDLVDTRPHTGAVVWRATRTEDLH